ASRAGFCAGPEITVLHGHHANSSAYLRLCLCHKGRQFGLSGKALMTTSTSAGRFPSWAIVLTAGIIVGMAMGLRQVMGLYLKPMTTELDIGREPFSNAMAIANLVWGIGAVLAGAIADRYGAGRVIVACA